MPATERLDAGTLETRDSGRSVDSPPTIYKTKIEKTINYDLIN